MNADGLVKIRRALLSVSNKTGIVRLGRTLAEDGVEIISTGGTAKALRDQGIPVTEVSRITGFPEIMDGRVKTLHPKVHGGLLADHDNKEHLEAMRLHGIGPIDLLVVDLYPFGTPSEMAKLPYDEVVELIDIGGVAMIRAAAKNHKFVAVVTSHLEYDKLCISIGMHSGTLYKYRQSLMRAAFKYTADFDKRVNETFDLLSSEGKPVRTPNMTE